MAKALPKAHTIALPMKMACLWRRQLDQLWERKGQKAVANAMSLSNDNDESNGSGNGIGSKNGYNSPLFLSLGWDC